MNKGSQLSNESEVSNEQGVSAEQGVTQVSYGKGPDYFRLKTAVFPVSVFLLLFSMKFGTELENYQYDSLK